MDSERGLGVVRYFVSIILLVCVVSVYTILSDIGTLVVGENPQGSGGSVQTTFRSVASADSHSG